MTEQEFISKARKIHGDKYDYSKVEYVNCKVKVCIICPKHGEFWQKPDLHTNKKNGCPLCAKLQRVKWTYDDCYQAAKQCTTLKEFKKRFGRQAKHAYKNGFLKDFDWLEQRFPPGYWTRERCFEEAKKYKTQEEFRRKNQYVFNHSKKMGWLNDYTWLDSKLLTKEKCFERSRKFTTRKDFNKYEARSYQKSAENGWLEEMTWLEETTGTSQNPYWTFERVKEVASKYNSRQQFLINHSGAYHAAKRNGWMDKLGLPLYVKKEKVYLVYSYTFEDHKTAYVGLTYRERERDEEHHGRGKYSDNPFKSPVYRFSVKNNIPIPEVKYHYKNLSIEEAQEKEDEIKNEFIRNGYKTLNRGKTGKNIGSYGNVGIKWNYNSCLEEAKKHKTVCEFLLNDSGAYDAAKRNSWLNDYTWLRKGRKKIDLEEAIKRARKYKTRTEFARKDATCHSIIRKQKKELLYEIFGEKKNCMKKG